MRSALIALCLLVAGVVVGCAGSSGCAVTDGSCVRVLFLGNSFTSTNDLPAFSIRITPGMPSERMA